MQFLSTLALLAASFSFAAAAPVEDAAKPKTFYLQAHITAKKEATTHGKFNGTYLVPYHTGAGFNDVAFVNQKLYKAVLNNTGLQLLIPNSGPYYTHFSFEDTYSAWNDVQINIGDATPDQDGTFFFNATGLQTTLQDFNGWRICDWSHGPAYPQLFWNLKYYAKDVPSNCELVNLFPVYA